MPDNACEKIAEKLKGTLEIGEDLEKVIDSYVKMNDIVLRKDAVEPLPFVPAIWMTLLN